MHNNQDQDFQDRMQRIETLVQQVEQSADRAARAAAQEMVRTLLEMHAVGLSKMLEAIHASGEPGRAVLNGWMQDELVRNLLLLHDLHPVDLPTRVQRALEKVRPYVSSHGGDVELMSVGEGVVRLRVEGGGGCSSSSDTLRTTIEQSIYQAAPDTDTIEIEGLEEQTSSESGLVQLGVSAMHNGQ